MRFFLAIAIAALVALPAQAQRTIRVPGEAPTIQAGINMAQPGDTVLLADGVYRGAGNMSLTMRGIDITVRSEGGAGACIIDMEGDGRAMHFYQEQTAAYVVEGITFRNGRKLDKGGAMWISGASPTVRDCVFEDCESYNGGAMWVGESASRIIGCVFRRCGTAEAGWTGGGILASGGSPTVDRCAFHGCAAERGGGVAIVGGLADVLDSSFNAGAATFGGATWIAEGASAVLVDCLVADNATTLRESGAIDVRGALAAHRATLHRNKGGGVFGGGDVTLTECIAADNDSTAVQLRGRSMIEDCVFERNGAGIVCFPRWGSFPEITVRRSEFLANGAALTSVETSASVEDCRFIGNEVIGGGDVTGYTIGPWFQRCEFRENQGGTYGFVSATDSSFIDNGPDFRVELGRFIRCEFARNTGRMSILGSWSGTSLHGCLIVDNHITEASDRSGLVASGGWLTFVNCTVIGNTGPSGVPIFFVHATTDQRGGLMRGNLALRNSIVEDADLLVRTADAGYHPLEMYGVDVRIDFSIVPAGPGAVELSPHSTLHWGSGNMQADPRLVNPAGGDYSLAPGSPCIDAGDSAAWLTWMGALDLAGNPRFHDDPGAPDIGLRDPARPELAIIDIGAQEFQGESPCRADLDGDGELTFFDFIAFQELFGAGDPRADFDFDGELTFFDFLAFQDAFAAGCG